MPSPFPGMDPYLEDPASWPDAHHELMSVLRLILNEQLRPRYVVRIEERVYVSDEFDPARRVIAPDVRVIQGRKDAPLPGESDVAVAEPLVLTTLIEEEVHEPRLEIIDARTRDVVTVIEVLSPANKVGGTRGQESYRRKRHEVMLSQVHFVEIDLLRGGERMPVEGGLPSCDYLMHVSRVETRPEGHVWPLQLQQPLPSIPIPVASEDPDARVDLKAAVDRVYENGGYDLILDYGLDPPAPAPSDEQRRWADEVLKTEGLR